MFKLYLPSNFSYSSNMQVMHMKLSHDNFRHGVKMPRYPWSDGPEYVTQCPISPGTRFRQRVVLSDEEGTLWWHAHSEWSRNSVYGALIILPPKTDSYPFPKPHAELPILLGIFNLLIQITTQNSPILGGA